MKLGTADDLVALDNAGINLAHFKEVRNCPGESAGQRGGIKCTVETF
jgi:hypothetical protein